MKEKILEISEKLKIDQITTDEAINLLLNLFDNKKELEWTAEQQEKANKYWDKETLCNLFDSNIPRQIVEHSLFKILSIDNHQEFINKSKVLKLIKETKINITNMEEEIKSPEISTRDEPEVCVSPQMHAIEFAKFVSNDQSLDDFWSMSLGVQEEVYAQFKKYLDSL